MLWLVLFHLLLFGPFAAYFTWRGQGDWGLVRERLAPDGSRAPSTVLVRATAPLSVRAAAAVALLLCAVFLIAGMCGGGLCAWIRLLGGMILSNLHGEELVSLWAGPVGWLLLGLVCGVDLPIVARALLQRRSNAANLARRIAILHIVLGSISTGLSAFVVSRPNEWSGWFNCMYVGTLVLAPLLVLHGLLLVHAASALDAYEASQVDVGRDLGRGHAFW
jgi:hypothetical protein